MNKALITVSTVAMTTLPVHAADLPTPSHASIASIASIAPDQFSGYVDANYGVLDIRGAGSGFRGQLAGASGHLNYNLLDRWNVQGDIYSDFAHVGGVKINGIGSAIHIYWRDPSRFALGGFVSMERIDDVQLNIAPGEYIAGLESQLYRKNVTIYGQGYFGQENITGLQSSNIYGGRIEVRYFIRDNMEFSVGAGYKRYNFGSFFADDKTSFAQVMYELRKRPISIFARYQYDRLGINNFVRVNSNQLRIGIILRFDGKSLFVEDRRGATMSVPSDDSLLFY